MKTLKSTFAYAGILAASVLLFAGAIHLNDQELGIGEYSDHANFNATQDLGIIGYLADEVWEYPPINEEDISSSVDEELQS